MPLAKWQVSGLFTFIQVSRFGFVLVEEELRGFLCMLLVMVKISNNELLCAEGPDTELLPDSSSKSSLQLLLTVEDTELAQGYTAAT